MVNFLEENEIDEHYIGPLNFKCNFCKALHFESEKSRNGFFSSCCQNGNT